MSPCRADNAIITYDDLVPWRRRLHRSGSADPRDVKLWLSPGPLLTHSTSTNNQGPVLSTEVGLTVHCTCHCVCLSTACSVIPPLKDWGIFTLYATCEICLQLSLNRCYIVILVTWVWFPLRTVQIINVDGFIKLVQSESPYCVFETFIEVVIYSRMIVVGFLWTRWHYRSRVITSTPSLVWLFQSLALHRLVSATEPVSVGTIVSLFLIYSFINFQ